MKLPLGKIAEFLAASGEFNNDAVAQGYSIDSRRISPGELFFAVRGERLDGHDFVASALANGAIAAVVARSHFGKFSDKSKLLVVEDTIIALQSLGANVRKLWNKTLIGVTGSAGKTTTKEAIAAVLASKYQVLKSEGNLNNHFGLPLQLLRLEPEHDVAVMEMGMSRAGEISALAKIARPQVGVVTMVAPVHLEFFASVEDIARAKYELIATLPDDGAAILNADDAHVSQFGRDFRGQIVTFGITHPADARAQNIEFRGAGGCSLDLVAKGSRVNADLRLLGVHNVYNALAAIAVGLQQGITLEQSATALSAMRPYDKRGEIIQVGGATVINDCYNSNPQALNAMVEALKTVAAKRHIVVAGEMLELGPSAAELHRESGRRMAASKIAKLLGVRNLAEEMVRSARLGGLDAEFVATPEEAADWLRKNVRADDAVLFKASRGVKLERALELWAAAVKSS